MTYIRLFRESGLMDMINGGGGDNLPNLEEEAQKAEAATAQEALKTEAYENGQLKPGYKLGDDGTTIIKDDALPADSVEGLNPDGTLQEGYEKDADGNIVKIATEDDDSTDPEDPESFYAEVSKITGREIKVEYPEGVDPLSYEGIAFRDNALYEQGAQDFEKVLAENDKRSYAYMLHRQAGGTDEEFFQSSAAFTLPDKETLETDADAQANLLRIDYRQKGLDETSIELLVKDAISKNTLKDQAVKVHAAFEKAQIEQEALIQKRYEEREKAINEAIGGMVKAIDTSIGNMRFVVPDANKAEFESFVKQNIQFDEQTGTFVLNREVTQESLQNVLESLFFQFKKGDLKTIVERQARTKAAQTIRLGIKTEKGPKGGGNEKKNEGDFIALGDLMKR